MSDFLSDELLRTPAIELRTGDDIRAALDLALDHFPERLDRAVELIRAQAELLRIELPENFGAEVDL